MTKAKKAKNRPRNAKRASASSNADLRSLLAFKRGIELVLLDDNGEWRELNSCADAVQDISGLLGQVRAAVASTSPAKVYILFHETNTGRGDESDGYVESVYGTKEAADAACLVAIRKARDAGEDIWCDPDDEDDDGDPDWEHDWHVEEHEVQP